MAWRETVESGFERWGHFAARHRVVVIISMLALSSGLIAFAPLLRTAPSSE